MPAMSVLTVTIIRTIFLNSPFHWRIRLAYKNQFALVFSALIISFFLGFLPLCGLCKLRDFKDNCVLEKNWGPRSMTCFTLTLGMGLLFPKMAVVFLYVMIYRIVGEARRTSKMLSSSCLTTSQNKESTDSPAVPSKRSSTQSAKERESIPISLLIVVILNVASTLPWIALIGFPELLYRDKKSEYYLILDIAYATLLVATAVNPLAYLITTRVVRKKTMQCFQKMFKKM